MRKIIIIGATSGIGREMARLYAGAGYFVGATGRRQELLYTLQLEYPNTIVTECFDITGPGATTHLQSLTRKLGGLDILVYCAGWGELTEGLDWEIDKGTVDINVNGFLEAVHYGWKLFTRQGHGHLVTISSVASVRGNRHSPAYSASKAFQSTYFEGLHMKARRMGIPLYLTDVQPGFVDTQMAKGPGRFNGGRPGKGNITDARHSANDGPSAKSQGRLFWVAPAEKAARQIMRAIDTRRWRVYVTRRWWIIAKLGKWMPAWVYHRIG
jgi:short-subunit dehydrogenase